MRKQVHLKSQWAAITAESDRCGYQRRGNYQPDPEPGSGQVSSGSELKQRINCNAVLWAERESCVTGAEHAIFQHRYKMRCVERNLLKNADGEQR